MVASGELTSSRQSGLAMSNQTLRAAVPKALHHVAGFPIRPIALAPLLQRIWGPCHNVTAYDAAYVALSERLDGHW
jgi:predicted nucleic acid-binding protein